MKWFRSNIKHGARLALVALAVQFALSFGHFHGAAALAAVAAQPNLQTIISQDSANGISKGLPAPNHDRDGQPGSCAICAVLALASSVLHASPPILLLPQAYHFLYLTTDAEFNHLQNRRAVFQPRAPPAS